MNKSILNKLLSYFPINPIIEDNLYLSKELSKTKRISLSFKSLGDLILCPLLVRLFLKSNPKIQIADIKVEEEYYDYIEFLNHLKSNFITIDDSNSDFFIGCFDTNVKAYNSAADKYDYVFPIQHLRSLFIPSFTQIQKDELKRLIFNNTELNILTIGSFSCSTFKGIKASRNNEINKDFINTNDVRFLHPNKLLEFIENILETNIVDRIILTPRNISEEQKGFNNLLKHPEVGIINANSIETSNHKCLILAGKGILKQIYAISQYSIVMGYHNIIEPILSNPNNVTYCIDSVKEAPNYLFWQCAERLQLVKSFNYSDNLLNEIFLSITDFKNQFERFSLADYKKDILFKNSVNKVNYYLNQFNENVSQ